MFDAYSVKKILPRLVIAVIGIQLSWIIFTNVILIVNLIAYGIEGLIYAPFGGASHLTLANILATGNGTSGLFAALVGAGALGAVGAAVSLGGVVSLALTCLLAIFIGFTMLVLRRVLIIFLLVLAPVALVAWIIPGTEKYWKLWWESFFKLLLLYPMIIGVVAVGRVFAYIAIQPPKGSTPGGSGGGLGTITSISQLLIVLVGVFGPFFLIPKLFTLAGSAFANLTGAVNNRSKGAFDRLRNSRANTHKKNWEDTKNFNRLKRISPRLANGLGYMANANRAGFNPRHWSGRLGAARSEASLLSRDQMLEDKDYTWKGNDDLNRAAQASTNEASLRQILQNSGNYTNDPAGRANMERDIAKVERMRRKYGTSAFRQATWLQAMAGGTAFDNPNNGNVNGWEAAVAVAGNDDSVLADLVAKGRSAAMSAGKVDQGGAGFGDTFNIARNIRDGVIDPNTGQRRQYSGAEARRDLARRVYDSQGGAVLLHSSMKPSAVENLTPAINESVEMGVVGDAQHQATTRTASQSLASLAATYDGLAASSPEKARAFADGVMSQEIRAQDLTPQMMDHLGMNTYDANGNIVAQRTHITYQEAIENMRGDPQFLEMRREYGASQARQAAAMQAQAAMGGQGGPPTAPPAVPGGVIGGTPNF